MGIKGRGVRKSEGGGEEGEERRIRKDEMSTLDD